MTADALLRRLVFSAPVGGAAWAVGLLAAQALRPRAMQSLLLRVSAAARMIGQGSPERRAEESFLQRERFLARFLELYPPSRLGRLIGRGLQLTAHLRLRRLLRRLAPSRAPDLVTLFYSPTTRCNLTCAGCYTASQQGASPASLAAMRLMADEATAVGAVALVIVGHGEPFVDEESTHRLLRLAAAYPWLNFIVYTNGTTVDEPLARELARHLNLFVLVSIDGPERENDERRGAGVYRLATAAMDRLLTHHVPFGFAVTVTSRNHEALVQPTFIDAMARRGCLVGIYCVYAPVDVRSSTDLVLSNAALARYRAAVVQVAGRVEIPVVDPEIFEMAHGCSARNGRTLYVDGVSGQIRPCVKYPIGPDDAVLDGPGALVRALQHPFFVALRRPDDGSHRCPRDPCGELDALCAGLPEDEGQRRFAQGYRQRLRSFCRGPSHVPNAEEC